MRLKTDKDNLTGAMKLRKILLYLACLVMAFALLAPMSGCKPSYRNTRKISKNRKVSVKRHRYAKSYNKKVSKHPVPINRKYIIKTHRRTSYHF